MLALCRKPPGEEPESSRPSARSLVVPVVLRTEVQPRV
ncbi:MAG TPA: hypothetical protein DDX19_01755 [Rhodopirellula baltica]|nr:hypothetical protein [Rhodopirellula baltica]